MTEKEFETLLNQASSQLREKQEHLDQQYELSTYTRWSFEQATGTLQFFDQNDRLKLEADVINIGSYSSKSNSWRWAWCNPSILEHLRKKAERLKELEDITGVQLFGHDTAFSIEGESMAWAFAALAVKHLSALGCYRAQSTRTEGLQIFLVIINVRQIGEGTP